MKGSFRLLLVTTAAIATTAWGQPAQRDPHIGYLYPAGGQRGTTFTVIVGGQALRGVTDIHVSGKGVRASFVQHYRPLVNLKAEERQALQKRFQELIEKRRAEWTAEGGEPPQLGGQADKATKNGGKPKAVPQNKAIGKTGAPPGGQAPSKDKVPASTTQPEADQLPEHPMLYGLENKSLRELLHIRQEFFNFKKRQPNLQIAESVLIQVTIDPTAPPGDREIRLGGPLGLTNPMCFQVGASPETGELEPNDPKAATLLPDAPPLDLPVLFNGQVKPGDVDRFRFRARRGQKLVIEAWARHLVPYLADAVPGWFQATLALYDAEGKEVAFADDYRFDPDPILLYEVPKDGVYTVEIHDSIYRGREDFVYRIAVGEQPFITRSFPLGGRRGSRAVASIDGWNLSGKKLPLPTPFEAGTIRETVLRQKEQLSNPVTYVVDVLPESGETEPNDSSQKPQPIDLPLIVNGTVAKPGDVDVFQFNGKAGDQVVAEVLARRLGSPLDSLLRLTDASGRVLEWNDDHEDKESGLLTHHADSYLRARLPTDGVFYVHLSDAQRQGGEAYGYRLRLGPPRPDFALRLTPSSINVRPGGSVPICVHAFRKDGFDDDIEVILKDPPAGFILSGGRIPHGRDRVCMTLTGPREPSDKPVVLSVEGRAKIGGKLVSRPVVPAEDLMQAFIYQHLAPAQELMVATVGPRRPMPPVELADSGPVRLPAGGTAQVRFTVARRPMLQEIRLELRDPPKGVSLQEVTTESAGLAFVLKADRDAVQVGFADNLIVEAFAEAANRRPGAQAQKKERVSLGVLPAIPFEIVQR